MITKSVAEINKYVGSSVNPMATPDQIYELYSVPSFESGSPEIVSGADIGSTKVIVEEGDILICKINPRINRVWVVHHNTEHPLLASSEWIVVRNASMNSDYLKWYFSSPIFRTLLTSQVTGIGGSLTRAQPKQVAKYPVPIPSRDEQDYVADILTRIDNLMHKYQQQIIGIEQLVKSRFIELFGDPIANPLGWPVKRLDDISVLITNGNTPKGGSDNYVSEGIVFLRSQNVWRNKIDLDDVAYIDAATHADMAKSSLHDKDILITKTGRINTENSSLGRAALFRGADNSANINGHVYLVRLGRTTVPEYVVAILTGEPYRRYIRKVCVGGIDKRQINLDQVEDFPIILPPIELQEQFTAFIEQTDKSKLAVQKGLQELEILKKSLMQQYFG